MRDNVINFLKGVVMGAAMLIPGVSGGTTAIILGIYEKLINAVSNILNKTKSSLVLLFVVGVGGIVGVVLFSTPLLVITKTFEKPMMYLFIGAVLAGVPLLYKKAGIKRIGQLSLKCFIYQTLGAVIVLLMDRLPKDVFEFKLNFWGYILLIISGLITAIALILPGISVSYVLLIMGVYDRTLTAIQGTDISFLLPLILSVAVGVVLTSKLLQRLMEDYTKQIFMIISGFVIGSVFTVFPGMAMGAQWFICPLAFIIGFVGILRLSRLSF